MTSQPLSLERLEALLEALRAQRAPVVQNLNRGLTDLEIQEATGRLGMSLPAEVSLWWSWHNGASLEVNSRINDDHRSIGPENRLFTLDEAIRAREESMALATELAPTDPEHWWKVSWLPITSREIAVDCVPSVSDSSLVRSTDPNWDPENQGRIVAESVGELVDLWILALSNGIWNWDDQLGEYGGWRQDDSRVTQELRMTGQF